MKFTDEQLNEITDYYKDLEIDPSKITRPNFYVDDDGFHFEISMESYPGVTVEEKLIVSKDISRESYENCPTIRMFLEDISYDDFMRAVNEDYDPEPVQIKPNLRLVKDGE